MLLLAALMLALPSAALAGPNDVIRDCNEDGDLDRDYSDGELKNAEDNLPSDIDEYTDCRDVIRDARTRSRGSGGSGGGGGFGSPGADGSGDPSLRTESGAQAESQAHKDALGDATKDRSDRAREAAAVAIDGQRVTPGGRGTFQASRTAANELPPPVVAVLAAVALLAMLAALAAARGKRPWTRVRLPFFRR